VGSTHLYPFISICFSVIYSLILFVRNLKRSLSLSILKDHSWGDLPISKVLSQCLGNGWWFLVSFGSSRLLLDLASTVMFSFGFRGLDDHIFLSHISGSRAATPISLECYVAMFKYLVRTSKKTLMMTMSVTLSSTVSTLHWNNDSHCMLVLKQQRSHRRHQILSGRHITLLCLRHAGFCCPYSSTL
jgi:hypothetical protein